MGSMGNGCAGWGGCAVGQLSGSGAVDWVGGDPRVSPGIALRRQRGPPTVRKGRPSTCVIGNEGRLALGSARVSGANGTGGVAARYPIEHALRAPPELRPAIT